MPNENTATHTIVNHRFDNNLLARVEADRERRSEAAGAKVSRAATITALLTERLADREEQASRESQDASKR